MGIRLLWFFQTCRCGAIGVLLLLFSSGAVWSGDLQLFRIGTGGQLGVYYPIGDALARGISSSGSAGKMIAVAQTSGGSVANVRALILGDIEAGLVQADVAFWALRGEGPFAGEKGWPVRALASLYPERLQILVRQEAGIKSINDFKGKAISLDEAGSGTLAVMRIVLEAHGLTEMDVKPVYLKPEFTTDRLFRGKLDGISLVAGTPARAIANIIGPDYFLVPIEPQVAADISRIHPYFVPGVIPAGTYPGISETPTLQVHALFLVREDMNADVVYELMSAMWNEQTRSLLVASHHQGRSVTKESALDGLTVPLHPGAVRFYQEQGMLQGEDGTP